MRRSFLGADPIFHKAGDSLPETEKGPGNTGVLFCLPCLFLNEILIELHQDAGCLSTNGCTTRVQTSVVVTIDEFVAVCPFHSFFGPIRDNFSIGEGSQICCGGDVQVLELRVVKHHLGKFFAGNRVIRLEGPVTVTGGHAVDPCPQELSGSWQSRNPCHSRG